jgi:hypothetical protein
MAARRDMFTAQRALQDKMTIIANNSPDEDDYAYKWYTDEYYRLRNHYDRIENEVLHTNYRIVELEEQIDDLKEMIDGIN